MKVITRRVDQWDPELQDYVLVEEESFEYDGPVALAGGGGGQTTTQTSEPPAFLKPFLGQAAGAAQNIFNQGPQEFFPGSTVAPQSEQTQAGVQGLTNFSQTPTNTAAINAGLQSLQNVSQLAQPGGNVAANVGAQAGGAAGDFLTNQIQNAGQISDPFLEGVINNALRINNQNLTRNLLPAIDSNALATNTFGGSRQGIAEGLAVSDANQQNLGTIANLLSGEFNRSTDRGFAASNLGLNQANVGANQTLDAIRTQAGIAPGVQQLALPGITSLLQAGTIEDQFASQLLQDEINRFNFGQNAEQQRLNNFINSLTPLAFGGTTTSTGPGISGGQGFLGGALGGLGAAGALGLTNPFGIAALGLGAGGLGLL